MMKVAVVCAFPANNLGMLSVDLSIDSVLARLDTPVELTRFCAEVTTDTEQCVTYVELKNQSQLEDFDKIIFWGDFLHWEPYSKNDWYIRHKKRFPDITDEEIYDKWYSLLMLENAPHLQKKSIIFGVTVYGLQALILDNPRYMSALKNLYSNAELALMRDIHSANLLTQLCDKQISVGCDAAFLLDSDKLLLDNPCDIDAYDKLSYSFGRSGCNELLKKYTSLVADRVPAQTFDLSWFSDATVQNLADRIDVIRKSKFVITDIYHLAITAWREGIPAICIGKGSSVVLASVDDKKKEILYRQMFAANNYIYTEEVFKAFADEKDLHNLINTHGYNITNQNQNSLIFEMLEKQKARTLATLIDHLS